MRELILTFDGGGLCNRIFPFANALAAGWEHNFRVVNPTFFDYRQNFRCDVTSNSTSQSHGREYAHPQFQLPLWRWRQRVIARLTPGSLIRVPESEPLNLDSVVTDRSLPGRLWVEVLYCLAPESFERHSDALRDFFRPVKRIENEVDACLTKARSRADVLVGVHIRQGDYQFHDNGMLYYDTNEYVSTMQQVRSLFPGKVVRFLICSNVPQDRVVLSEVDWYPGPGGQVTDLYALAGCDYIIGAPSSYTQWASFYGQVPRYVLNRKYERLSGQKSHAAVLEDFLVHRIGFGRHVTV